MSRLSKRKLLRHPIALAFCAALFASSLNLIATWVLTSRQVSSSRQEELRRDRQHTFVDFCRSESSYENSIREVILYATRSEIREMQGIMGIHTNAFESVNADGRVVVTTTNIHFTVNLEDSAPRTLELMKRLDQTATDLNTTLSYAKTIFTSPDLRQSIDRAYAYQFQMASLGINYEYWRSRLVQLETSNNVEMVRTFQNDIIDSCENAVTNNPVLKALAIVHTQMQRDVSQKK